MSTWSPAGQLRRVQGVRNRWNSNKLAFGDSCATCWYNTNLPEIVTDAHRPCDDLFIDHTYWTSTMPARATCPARAATRFYVYIFAFVRDPTILKIGYSYCPARRLDALTRETKSKWAFVSCAQFDRWYDAWAIEQFIHECTLSSSVSIVDLFSVPEFGGKSEIRRVEVDVVKALVAGQTLRTAHMWMRSNVTFERDHWRGVQYIARVTS